MRECEHGNIWAGSWLMKNQVPRFEWRSSFFYGGFRSMIWKKVDGFGWWCLDNGGLWRKLKCPKLHEVLWVKGIIISLHHFPLFCVYWRMLYIIGNNWKRWWTTKGFQEWLDCGICDGKERWCIFGTEYGFGVREGVPILVGALKIIIVTWNSKGLLGHTCS